MTERAAVGERAATRRPRADPAPRVLAEYVGQEKIVDNLRVFIRAARERGEPLDHVCSSVRRLGKTTLAHIVAHEMGAPLRTTAGPVLERPATWPRS